MQPQTSYRLRGIMPLVACALGLLLGSCSSSSSSPPDEAVSYACAAPPADISACTTDTDCAIVARGCYCGAQPVDGVARKYVAAAQGCEDTAAGACAMGCANNQGGVTQDGTKVAAGARTAAHCDHSGATGVCKSYVPPAGGGGGDPVPTGW